MRSLMRRIHLWWVWIQGRYFSNPDTFLRDAEVLHARFMAEGEHWRAFQMEDQLRQSVEGHEATAARLGVVPPREVYASRELLRKWEIKRREFQNV